MNINDTMVREIGNYVADRLSEKLDEYAGGDKSGGGDLKSDFSDFLTEVLSGAQAPSGREQEVADTGTNEVSEAPATTSAPDVGLAEGTVASSNNDGYLHVHREPDAALPWDGKGANTAVKEYWDASLMPDASGLVNGQVAPGLEGWNEAVNDGRSGDYWGYKDYLESNYPGGYDKWRQDYDGYRRNALLGEDNAVRVANTSGKGGESVRFA